MEGDIITYSQSLLEVYKLMICKNKCIRILIMYSW